MIKKRSIILIDQRRNRESMEKRKRTKKVKN